MDAQCSRVMEKLLASCSDADLVRYLGGITSAPADFFTLCKSLFGSRVAEPRSSASRRAWARAPSDDLLASLEAPIAAISDALVASAVDAAYDPRVSPVARKFLSLLAGRECARRPRGGRVGREAQGRHQRGGRPADSADAPPERHRFASALNAFGDAALAALEPELWNLTEDACGSAFLQTLLNAHRGDDAARSGSSPGFSAARRRRARRRASSSRTRRSPTSAP